MFLFHKRHPGLKTPKKVKPQAVVVWSPAGDDTAELSLSLARELARQARTLLVELPCLGIPRLGFAANIMDRGNHTDALILEMHKKGEISLERVPKASDTLSILAADVFALPDYPATHKVELETLIGFPGEVINKALRDGYSMVVVDCQGQFTTPMTHFALRHADRVLIPVRRYGGLAFSLLNVKRLVQAFRHEPAKFWLLARENLETIAEIAVLKDEEGREVGRLKVLEEEARAIAQELAASAPEAVGAGPGLPAEMEGSLLIRL